MTSNEQIKKLLWAYMIDNGSLTTGKWNYYSGCWEPHITGMNYDWKKVEKDNKEFKEKVKSIGVDWENTLVPESTIESAFIDTFSDSDRVEALSGIITLRDGSEYIVGVNNADKRFSSYIIRLSELAEDENRIKKIFGE